MRKQLNYARRYVAGTYSKLRLVGRDVSHTIHLAARAYAAAQPMLKRGGFDTSTFDRAASTGYEAFKDLESRAQAGDSASQTMAAHLRPKFTPYS